jgi:uncharacterized protein DUF4126
MDLLLDILQGAGLAAAAGVAPLPALLVAGLLATGDLGLDFDHSRYDFLESPAFLIGVVAAFVVVALLGGRGGGKRWTPAVSLAIALGGLAAGALLFAGSLADRSDAAWPGLIAGPACALLGIEASRGIVQRAAGRVEGASAKAVELSVDLLVAAAAALAIAAPPLSVVLVVLLGLLALGERRRGGERYAGLRVLR